MSDVQISYKGSSIAGLSDTGTKILGTAEKYCEDDITISYTKTAGSATTPATTITANPTITISTAGLITATVSSSKSITPTVSAGYVSTGTAGTVTVSGSATNQMTLRNSSSLSVSGATVTAPAGYYAADASKSVTTMNLPTNTSTTPSGTQKAQITADDVVARYINIPVGYNATAAYYKINQISTGYVQVNDVTITANPTGTVNSSTGVVTMTASASREIGASVYEGYVETAHSGTATVSGTGTLQLSTQAAKTVTPTESSQTAVAAGKYTTGAVTVAAISSTYVGTGVARYNGEWHTNV